MIIRTKCGTEVLVDDDAESIVAGHQWYWHRTRGYACRRGTHGPAVILHRVLIGAPLGVVVDHLNGDTRDNRRSNLRVATFVENARNSRKKPGTSRFKGVHWCARDKNWQAMIRKGTGHGGRFLGSFDDEIDAARAYDAVARLRHGGFACVNFPKLHERGAIPAPVTLGAMAHEYLSRSLTIVRPYPARQRAALLVAVPGDPL